MRAHSHGRSLTSHSRLRIDMAHMSEAASDSDSELDEVEQSRAARLLGTHTAMVVAEVERSNSSVASGAPVTDPCEQRTMTRRETEALRDRTKTRVKCLTNNVRTQRMSLSKSGAFACWRVIEQDGATRTYAGLTSRLSDLFFNSAAYDLYLCPPDLAVDEDDDAPTDDAQSDADERRMTAATRRAARDCHGALHGQRVHEEMQRYVCSFVQHQSPQRFMDEHGRDLDVCTHRVIRYLALRGWTPLCAELRVFDCQTRTATAIDLVVLDCATYRIIALELKTGYGGRVGTRSCFIGHADTPMMRGCLDFIPDSPFYRAIVQIMMSYILLYMGEKAERGGGVQIAVPDEIYVMHMHPLQPQPRILPPPRWMLQQPRRQAMYSALLQLARAERAAPVPPPPPMVGEKRPAAFCANEQAKRHAPLQLEDL